MSVVVTCNLSDGVIVGTDSAITIHGQVQGPKGIQTGVLKVYKSAEKLFQLENLPIAVATYGIGMLGERSIGSYVKEFEFTFKASNRKKGGRQREGKLEHKTVGQIATSLRGFFLGKYKEIFTPLLEKELGVKFDEVPDAKKPLLGLIVTGFSPRQYLSEVWHVKIPISEKDKGLLNIREPGKFGTNWFGQIDSIFRLIKGCDRNLPNRVIDYLVKTHGIKFSEKDKTEVENIIKQFEYRIPYAAMPIQEGIDHVKFLLDVVINQTKFVIGAEVCGGPVRIGVVQRGEREFRIITENELTVT